MSIYKIYGVIKELTNYDVNNLYSMQIVREH